MVDQYDKRHNDEQLCKRQKACRYSCVLSCLLAILVVVYLYLQLVMHGKKPVGTFDAFKILVVLDSQTLAQAHKHTQHCCALRHYTIIKRGDQTHCFRPLAEVDGKPSTIDPAYSSLLKTSLITTASLSRETLACHTRFLCVPYRTCFGSEGWCKRGSIRNYVR